MKGTCSDDYAIGSSTETPFYLFLSAKEAQFFIARVYVGGSNVISRYPEENWYMFIEVKLQMWSLARDLPACLIIIITMYYNHCASIQHTTINRKPWLNEVNSWWKLSIESLLQSFINSFALVKLEQEIYDIKVDESWLDIKYITTRNKKFHQDSNWIRGIDENCRSGGCERGNSHEHQLSSSSYNRGNGTKCKIYFSWFHTALNFLRFAFQKVAFHSIHVLPNVPIPERSIRLSWHFISA